MQDYSFICKIIEVNTMATTGWIMDSILVNDILINYIWWQFQFLVVISNQRTNDPVNAHLILWPSKAQIELTKPGRYMGQDQEITLTFNTHKRFIYSIRCLLLLLSGHWPRPQ